MIRNDRQYRITRSQARKFEKALREMPGKLATRDIHPLFKSAQLDALKSQYDELMRSIEDYEKLKSGDVKRFHLRSFEDLPTTLIQARIAAGMSQKDLANQLGLAEQQIQRYEISGYSTASITRINEVLQALGVEVEKYVMVQDEHLNFKILISKLGNAGLPRDFVLSRLLPNDIVERIKSKDKNHEEGLNATILQAGSIISNLFGWSTKILFDNSKLAFNDALLSKVKYKVPKNTDKKRINAYTLYTIMLGHNVLQTTSHLKTSTIPSDAQTMRKTIIEQYGHLTFENALKYTWSLGIPVLPLSDSGMFHGACLRVKGRNVIILKQNKKSESRWLFDLIHELWHAGQNKEQEEFMVLEDSEEKIDWLEKQEEQEAIKFAGDVTLDSKAEELVQACVDAAQGNIRLFKSVVTHIAEGANVAVGVLSNYIAYRLSLQGINWWGTATNLQETERNPWEIARDMLVTQANLDVLNKFERELLLRALT